MLSVVAIHPNLDGTPRIQACREARVDILARLNISPDPRRAEWSVHPPAGVPEETLGPELGALIDHRLITLVGDSAPEHVFCEQHPLLCTRRTSVRVVDDIAPVVIEVVVGGGLDESLCHHLPDHAID
jgi:hypothetical protein